MIQPTQVPGVFVCDEHPNVQLQGEQAAAAHLQRQHPELWDYASKVEVVPLNNRGERRAARHAARRRGRRAAR